MTNQRWKDKRRASDGSSERQARRAFGWAGVIVLSAMLGGVGCGASMPASPGNQAAAHSGYPAPPPAAPQYETADVQQLDEDEVLALLAEAERNLVASLEQPEPGMDHPDEPGVEQPSALTTPREHGQGYPTRDPCEIACRALESMQRSADRLCGLTGEDDPRCEMVRGRLERARDLVQRSCPSCEAAYDG